MFMPFSAYSLCSFPFSPTICVVSAPLYYERSFLLAHSPSVREGEEGLNEYIVMANDKMGVSRCNLAC